ncbi:type II toxin-antitoxin system RelE/ParE family toxin [Iodobacter sp. CM08]|uniref:type II toxin-antitoxin system RelE/ParE family toxin n=1 Tax=Iodobacter sp. CM08 TaxID=3085902 RepID=UPI0029824CE6|nr:type II toxin-antitoxin system RelE/ParE family toxin [Iodobacter sp. CM08]MDW5418432.1 type II toxin-antitoxin system RelE/ParE family toxin [Iodobacter sp. CM08]
MNHTHALRLRWLRKAIANLDAEAEYITQENPQAAAEMFAYVKAKVEDLVHFPASGRLGRVLGTRELVIDRYPFLVPYRVVGNELHVLRVFHTSRKPPLSW